MNIVESANWHNKRNELFRKSNGSIIQLDRETTTAIAEALPSMEFERAMRALAEYRERKPFRGFWWNDFLSAYERDETAASAKAAAARPPSDHDERLNMQAKFEQRQEVQDFNSLPVEFVADCRQTYANWGIPIDPTHRGWRLLCIDAFAGRDVSAYRVHDKRERKRSTVEPLTENQRNNLIESLRMENWLLRVELDPYVDAEPLPF